MQVDFKYELENMVITPFGNKGIVSMVAIDNGGQTYYVKEENGTSNWWPETQLTECTN